MTNQATQRMHIIRQSRAQAQATRNAALIQELTKGRPDLKAKALRWLDKEWSAAAITAAIKDEVENGVDRKRPARSKSVGKSKY
jgi:hypothetical protein